MRREVKEGGGGGRLRRVFLRREIASNVVRTMVLKLQIVMRRVSSESAAKPRRNSWWP